MYIRKFLKLSLLLLILRLWGLLQKAAPVNKCLIFSIDMVAAWLLFINYQARTIAPMYLFLIDKANALIW